MSKHHTTSKFLELSIILCINVIYKKKNKTLKVQPLTGQTLSTLAILPENYNLM